MSVFEHFIGHTSVSGAGNHHDSFDVDPPSAEIIPTILGTANVAYSWGKIALVRITDCEKAVIYTSESGADDSTIDKFDTA